MASRGAVITLGTFDGVHRGHQAVLAEVGRRARAGELASVLVTFDPHPLEVVNPAAAPKLLTLTDEKRELVAAHGIEQFVVLPFTPAVAQLDAAAFVRRLCDEYAMRELVMGFDHGFGRGRGGDVELVRRLGEAQQFGVSVVDAVRENGQPISSTLIRTAVAHGDLDAAARWLGRSYSLRGRVVRGAGRGRTIGVPTANLETPDARKLLPPDGVYAVRVRILDLGVGISGQKPQIPTPRSKTLEFGGMMNQGPRPTFGEQARALEIHLFDFEGELYGETVVVEWVRRLREVQAFPSREALVAQLERDRQAARATLNR
ncbi:MAG TPA: bifunctional riboflavin kinase/FAD synthetase [Gemmatimonadales bacterium]|nr:bifunctional riboflavin kinase/FAD synthetase [Gemmatimonadales bacterium]